MTFRSVNFKAFSLVEMLVAVVIFGIISLSIYGAFAAGMKLNARSERNLKAYGDALLALEKMTLEMENMVDYDFSGSYPDKKAFIAAPGSVQFLLAKEDGLKAVRYTLQMPPETAVRSTTIGQTTDKNVEVKNISSQEASRMLLVRQERDFVDFLQDGFENTDSKILSEAVVANGLTFRFAQKRSGGVDWTDSPPVVNLPSGVRVELTLASKDSQQQQYHFSRDVLIPAGNWARGN